jgi:hypothetical protein
VQQPSDNANRQYQQPRSKRDRNPRPGRLPKFADYPRPQANSVNQLNPSDNNRSPGKGAQQSAAPHVQRRRELRQALRDGVGRDHPRDRSRSVRRRVYSTACSRIVIYPPDFFPLQPSRR